MQNSLCVQLLRSPILAALLHGTPAAGVSQTLRHGTRNGMTVLSQRAPPIFAWAAIMLAIGPHSSFDFVFLVLVKRLTGNSISKMTYFCRVGCKTLTESIVLTCIEVSILYSDFLMDTVYEMLPIYMLDC